MLLPADPGGHTKGSVPFALIDLKLDFDIDARRQVQLGQRVRRSRGGAGDIDQSLVCSLLKLLSGVLILMYSPQDGDHFLLRGKGDRAGNFGADFLAVSTIFAAELSRSA